MVFPALGRQFNNVTGANNPNLLDNEARELLEAQRPELADAFNDSTQLRRIETAIAEMVNGGFFERRGRVRGREIVLTQAGRQEFLRLRDDGNEIDEAVQVDNSEIIQFDPDELNGAGYPTTITYNTADGAQVQGIVVGPLYNEQSQQQNPNTIVIYNGTLEQLNATPSGKLNVIETFIQSGTFSQEFIDGGAEGIAGEIVFLRQGDEITNLEVGRVVEEGEEFTQDELASNAFSQIAEIAERLLNPETAQVEPAVSVISSEGGLDTLNPEQLALYAQFKKAIGEGLKKFYELFVSEIRSGNLNDLMTVVRELDFSDWEAMNFNELLATMGDNPEDLKYIKDPEKENKIKIVKIMRGIIEDAQRRKLGLEVNRATGQMDPEAVRPQYQADDLVSLIGGSEVEGVDMVALPDNFTPAQLLDFIQQVGDQVRRDPALLGLLRQRIEQVIENWLRETYYTGNKTERHKDRPEYMRRYRERLNTYAVVIDNEFLPVLEYSEKELLGIDVETVKIDSAEALGIFLARYHHDLTEEQKNRLKTRIRVFVIGLDFNRQVLLIEGYVDAFVPDEYYDGIFSADTYNDAIETYRNAIDLMANMVTDAEGLNERGVEDVWEKDVLIALREDPQLRRGMRNPIAVDMCHTKYLMAVEIASETTDNAEEMITYTLRFADEVTFDLAADKKLQKYMASFETSPSEIDLDASSYIQNGQLDYAFIYNEYYNGVLQKIYNGEVPGNTEIFEKFIRSNVDLIYNAANESLTNMIKMRNIEGKKERHKTAIFWRRVGQFGPIISKAVMFGGLGAVIGGPALAFLGPFITGTFSGKEGAFMSGSASFGGVMAGIGGFAWLMTTLAREIGGTSEEAIKEQEKREELDLQEQQEKTEIGQVMNDTRGSIVDNIMNSMREVATFVHSGSNEVYNKFTELVNDFLPQNEGRSNRGRYGRMRNRGSRGRSKGRANLRFT